MNRVTFRSFVPFGSLKDGIPYHRLGATLVQQMSNIPANEK